MNSLEKFISTFAKEPLLVAVYWISTVHWIVTKSYELRTKNGIAIWYKLESLIRHKLPFEANPMCRNSILLPSRVWFIWSFLGHAQVTFGGEPKKRPVKNLR